MEKELVNNLKNVVKVFKKFEPNRIVEDLEYFEYLIREKPSEIKSYFEKYIKPIIDTIEENDLHSEIETSKYLLYEYEKNIHTTIEDFQKNNELDFDLELVSKECGMLGSYSLYDYIVCNKDTILTYKYFSERDDTFAVNCIYTKPNRRNKGSCKKLLKSLDFNSSLYFDTYSDFLIKLVKELGGYEENILSGKPSTQLILDV